MILYLLLLIVLLDRYLYPVHAEKERNLMMKWFRLYLTIGITVVLVIIVLAVLGYRLQWDWTGLPEHIIPDPQKYQPAKTAWDWLNLLGVVAIPVAVGWGAAWYTTQQGKVSARENTDNQREAALQAYIDRISELVLEKKLGQPEIEEPGVRNIARVRTLTVLRMLDPERKGSVLQFLYEAELIHTDRCAIDLRGADLSHAKLNKINVDTFLGPYSLSNINLHGANLRHANLNGAILWNADLSEADLRYADLRNASLIMDIENEWANLKNADLRGADLRGICEKHINLDDPDELLEYDSLAGAYQAEGYVSEYNSAVYSILKEAKSLKGATMPDGTKHP